MYVCDNCGKRFSQPKELKYVFPNIPDLLERLDPGGMVPVGECPECGAMVYPEDKPIRLLILLEGGLVQEVLADQPGVEATVLGQDTEGADEEEIVEIRSGDVSLRGTLQAQAVRVAPEGVGSAYRLLD